MKITKSSIERDLMVQGWVICVYIETIDNFDDPIHIKIIARITKFELKQFQVEPSWSGIKFTRQQVFNIINKLYPAECMSLNIGYLDDMKNMVPKLNLNTTVHDLVRRNIDLVLENFTMEFNGDRLYTASIKDEDKLSSRILEIFEEYKNIS
jgi:hypothetical protein